MNNEKLEKYLKEFKESKWMDDTEWLVKQRKFFKKFFKKENLEKMEWKDMQEMGDNIHSFNSFPIAKKKALGKPNHSMKYYRDSFLYLVYGEDDDAAKFTEFTHGKYKLKNFGENSASEIIGQAFSDKYVLLNGPDKKAVEFLGIELDYERGDGFGERYIKYNKVIKPIIEEYKKVIGLQNENLTIPIEVDQFFRYLYDNINDSPKPPIETEPVSNYWWLNTNPKIWDLADAKIGEKIIYTSHNEKGNKRRIFSYFNELKPGDKIIGYVSTPILEALALCETTKGLHISKEGEGFEFKKIEDFKTGVSFKELQEIEDLKECEPLKSNQGSLFKLKQDEFEIIRELLDEKNPKITTKPEKYTKGDALTVVFLNPSEFGQILDSLEYKKNIILQGPPGVGKTFIAKKIAYTMMGVKDESRIQMIQFHQSYSYEDFIQGYRPTDDGKFTLKNGIFYDFCRRAQRDKGNKYFFIIDEINRGNLSKIFGELMMLIEKDKRGEEFSMPLTYSKTEDEKFYIPENLYLIGTMNTADKSLAMVDYALRRRFCFSFLEPKFDEKFRDYLKESGVRVGLIDKIINRVAELNKIIKEDTKNLGKGYMIGHSYFCPDNNDYDYDEAWYKNVINNEIKPLLEEYWFDDEEKAKQEINKLID